jgi:DNA-binding IclR family transcriptional regulator
MEYNVLHAKTEPGRGVRPLSSVLKTLALIDVMAKQHKPARLADIARAAGMSRGTAHQKLVTLAHAGWIEQADNRYRLSLHITHVASAALEQADLGERMVGFLEDLAGRAKEAASLAVVEGGSVCIVQRVEAMGILRTDLHVGALMDLANSASGRVLAAFARESQLKAWRQNKVPLPDRKLLAKVQAEKFAVSSGTLYAGVRAIGAPVFDARGECIAALSLVGPVPRFNIDKLRPHLVRAANRISDHLKAGAP